MNTLLAWITKSSRLQNQESLLDTTTINNLHDELFNKLNSLKIQGKNILSLYQDEIKKSVTRVCQKWENSKE